MSSHCFYVRFEGDSFMRANIIYVDYDRYLKRLLACLALYADEPLPKTDADCRRLVATRVRMIAPWQLDTLRRWCGRQNRV